MNPRHTPTRVGPDRGATSAGRAEARVHALAAHRTRCTSNAFPGHASRTEHAIGAAHGARVDGQDLARGGVARTAAWFLAARAELADPVGSGPGYRHPVLVVSTDPFNDSRIPTVIVCVLTSNPRLARAPGNVHVSAHKSGLPEDSIANVAQVLTVAKRIERARRLARSRPPEGRRGRAPHRHGAMSFTKGASNPSALPS